MAAYRQPSTARSVFEIVVTAVPLVLLWLLIWAGVENGYWAVLLLSVPAAGLLLRLFIIQHDCGHGSFFEKRAANDWVGRVLGVFTMTPYYVWRRSHAEHHAANGNLDRRGIGDIDTLTIEEYRAKSPTQRVLYRLYRHPLVMFGLGPAYLFLLRHRLPIGLMRSGWQPWVSAFTTNLAIAAFVLAVVSLVGLGTFLIVHLPIMILAASMGVWLFYVQHQFEDTFWERDEAWTFHQGALHGSSHYDLPRLLHWFTGNIGIHHVHHLTSRIPFYRLPEVLRDRPELREVGKLSIRQSLRTVRLALWDDRRHRMVSFREARASI